MSLLEQEIIKKRFEKITELDVSNKSSKEYKVETMEDSAFYVRKLEDHLLGLHYFVTCKGYLAEENTYKLALAVQYLRKLISSFYKNHLKKPTATSAPINSTPPISNSTVKPTAKFPTKRKRGRLANSTNKQVKKMKPFAHSVTWLLPDQSSYLFAQVFIKRY